MHFGKQWWENGREIKLDRYWGHDEDIIIISIWGDLCLFLIWNHLKWPTPENIIISSNYEHIFISFWYDISKTGLHAQKTSSHLHVCSVYLYCTCNLIRVCLIKKESIIWDQSPKAQVRRTKNQECDKSPVSYLNLVGSLFRWQCKYNLKCSFV